MCEKKCRSLPPPLVGSAGRQFRLQFRKERKMRVIVFVKATADSENDVMPTTELLEAMGKYNEELINAGIMLGGEGLKATRHAKRVHFSGSDRSVIDGPFAETKEIVAGYWIWEVRDMDEAVEWVKRCPNPMFTESDIDIRPVFEMADFAALMTPEVQALHDSNVERNIAQNAAREQH
jgi:hypothetical protein